jgi:hypothetical protein
VTIALARGDATISREARQALMARLFHANIKAGMMTRGESTDGILRSLEAVGATRPVELTRGQRRLLLDVLRTWSENERWALEPDGRLPAGLILLRDGLPTSSGASTSSRSVGAPRRSFSLPSITDPAQV